MRDDSWAMAHRCRISKVAICWRLDRRENSRVRRTRPGRPFLSGNTSSKETMAKELENCLEQRMSTSSDKTTTWLPWSEARLLSTFQRTCWKHWTKKPVHHPAQRRQNPQQQFQGSEEYNYTVHPRTGWRYYVQQVRLHPRRQQNDERESNQSWDYWRSSTWTKQKNFKGRNQHRETCDTSPNKKWFRHDFSLVQAVVFSLVSNFQLPGNRRKVWTEHLPTLHVQTQTLCLHVTLTRGSRFELCPK